MQTKHASSAIRKIDSKAASLAAMVTRAQRDPIWFAEEILQLKKLPGDYVDHTGLGEFELDEWQKELFNAVADVWRKQMGLPTVINHEGKPWITIRAMHGPGKTLGMAAIDHYFQFCFPGRVFATAPKLKQVTTQLFPEFRKLLNRSVDWYKDLIDVQATSIRWCNSPDWILLPDSAANPENMAGKHWDYVLVNVDEASGVDEALWPVVLGALSVGKVLIMLCISNPTKNEGMFADQHLKPSIAQDYFRMHISLDKTRRVRRDWVAKMVRNYGAESPVVKVRCYGEFPGSSPNQLIVLDWLDRARRSERSATGDGSKGLIRVSGDISDGGEDECVFTGAIHWASYSRLLKCKRASYPLALSPILAADAMEEMFFVLGGVKGVDEMIVDGLGVGAGTAGTLMTRGHVVIVHRGGEGSDRPERWRNKRVQAYCNARDVLRDGLVDIADDFFDSASPQEDWDELCAQMCAVRTTSDGDSKSDDIETKEALLKRIKKSPDIADSVVMQWSTQSRSLEVGSMAGSNNSQPVEVQESSILEGLY